MMPVRLDKSSDTLAPKTSSGDASGYYPGLGLLRLSSIVFVVILHILGHGGVLESAEGAGYNTALLLKSLCICAVDCFVLISGFLLSDKEFRSRRVLGVWATALFYSVTLSAFVYARQDHTPSLHQLLCMFLPVVSRQWWFLTHYFAMVCFSFLINRGLKEMSDKALGRLVACLLLIFCCIPSAMHLDPFALAKGYVFGWLLVLYITGAYLKRVHVNNPFDAGGAPGIVLYLGCSAAIFLFAKMVGSERFPALSPYNDVVYSLSSPFVLFAAISLFWFFLKADSLAKPLQRLVSRISPSVFSIYLISDMVLMRHEFMVDAFVGLSGLGPLQLFAAVVSAACAISLGCILIDRIRIIIFDLLKAQSLIDHVGSRIDSALTE